MLLYIQIHLVYKFTLKLQSLHTRIVILNLIFEFENKKSSIELLIGQEFQS